jgi:hypothetical protein
MFVLPAAERREGYITRGKRERAFLTKLFAARPGSGRISQFPTFALTSTKLS